MLDKNGVSPLGGGVIYSDDGSVSGALHRGAFGHNDDSSLFGTGIGCEAVGRYRRKEHSVGGKRCEHRDVEALAFLHRGHEFPFGGECRQQRVGSQFPDICVKGHRIRHCAVDIGDAEIVVDKLLVFGIFLSQGVEAENVFFRRDPLRFVEVTRQQCAQRGECHYGAGYEKHCGKQSDSCRRRQRDVGKRAQVRLVVNPYSEFAVPVHFSRLL